MKSTLDLPDDLMRQVKLRAVNENRRIKDVVADLLRRALILQPDSSPVPSARRRVNLPIIPAPPGAPKLDLTPERIHQLEIEAEMERHDTSLR